MPIEDTDLKVFKAAVNNDTASNGGRMSAIESVTGSVADIWPEVQKSERDAGSSKFRKVFHKNYNVDDLPLQNTRVLLNRPTPGPDRVFLLAADQINTQGNLTGSEPLYGSGSLDATVLAGVMSIDVLVEDGATMIFRNTEMIRIWDEDVNGDTVNAEWRTISGVPTVLGDVVTIALSAALAFGYSSANTYVSSVIEAGTVQAQATGFVATSGSGTIDSTKTTAHNRGGVQESWTLTFTGTTTFDLVGTVLGNVGSGNISSTFAPVNPDTGTPYLSILAAMWGGTWIAGNTVTFNTSPSSVPVFEKRVIPAGSAPFAANNRTTLMWGETA